MRSSIVLVAALALTACQTSESGGGGGESATSAQSSGGDDGGGGDGGDRGDGEDREGPLVLYTWAWLQGRFSTEDADAPSTPKVMVGCAVDLPEIGSRALYVEHGDGTPDSEPAGQFVIVIDEETSPDPTYFSNGIARIHHVADPAAWTGRCNGDPMAALGAVETEPACELRANYTSDAGRGLQISGDAPAGCISTDAGHAYVRARSAVVLWDDGGGTHKLYRRTPVAPVSPSYE